MRFLKSPSKGWKAFWTMSKKNCINYLGSASPTRKRCIFHINSLNYTKSTSLHEQFDCHLCIQVTIEQPCLFIINFQPRHGGPQTAAENWPSTSESSSIETNSLRCCCFRKLKSWRVHITMWWSSTSCSDVMIIDHQRVVEMWCSSSRFSWRRNGSLRVSISPKLLNCDLPLQSKIQLFTI